MVHKVATAIPFRVQVLDSEGNPATGASVKFKVIDESNGVGAEQSTVHITLGIFRGTFTPDAAGIWTVAVYCSDPAFNTSFTWEVGTGLEQDIEDYIDEEVAAILEDVAGLAGAAMRGTDGVDPSAMRGTNSAALAANYTAERAVFLQELAAANLPADIDEGKRRSFRRTYALAVQSDSVSSASEENLSAPGTVTVTFPPGGTLLEGKVMGYLKANAKTAAGHSIGVTLQKNVAGGGWEDVKDLTANPALTLPAVDKAADSLVIVEAVAVTTGQTVQFRWQVDSDNAGEVHYVSDFVYVAEYDFQ